MRGHPLGAAQRALVLLALLAAGGCVTRTVDPASSAVAVAPQLSVERFLQASNERDLDAMARLFGTADGPIQDRGSWLGCAFKKIGSWFGGSPCLSGQDIELQMDAISDILRHDDYRIVREERVAGRSTPATRVLVDLTRDGETARAVPFVVVRTDDGRWLVELVGLEEAMNRR